MLCIIFSMNTEHFSNLFAYLVVILLAKIVIAINHFIIIIIVQDIFYQVKASPGNFLTIN